MRVGKPLANKRRIVDQPSRNGTRERVAAPFVPVVEPRLARQGLDELLATGQSISPVNVCKVYYKAERQSAI